MPSNVASTIVEYMGICSKVMPRTTKEKGYNRELLKAYILKTLTNISYNRVLSIIKTIMPCDIASIIMQYVGGRAQLPDSDSWDYKELAKQNSLWLQEYLWEHGYKEYTRRVVKLCYELEHYLNQDDASLVLEYLEDKKDFSNSFKENFNRLQLVEKMFYTYKGKKYRSRPPEHVIVGYDLNLPLRIVGRSRRGRNRRRRKALELYMLLSNRIDNPIDYWKYDGTPPTTTIDCIVHAISP